MAKILTLTLNPALDLTVRVAHLQPGDVNRSQAMLTHAAGKGVNVAISAKATTGFTMTFTNLSDVAADPAANVHLTIIGNG